VNKKTEDHQQKQKQNSNTVQRKDLFKKKMEKNDMTGPQINVQSQVSITSTVL
jgi:hypothetical protein